MKFFIASYLLIGAVIFPHTVQARATDAPKLYVPILTYHHIAPHTPHNPYFVSPKIFEEQMRWLKKNNYHVISYADFYHAMTTDEQLPRKSVVLTFDDGHRDQFINAFPILNALGFHAMFYVVGGYIERETSMTWDMLKKMRDAQMEIGAHSMTHPNLTRLTNAQRIAEISESKLILEKNLGIPINFFAYPGGAYNDAVIRDVIDAHFLSAVSVRHSVYHKKNENLFAVARMHIDDDMESFTGFVTGARLR